MSKGPGGYGRYNDDPSYVGCPRAKTDMTPCVARDGHLAFDESSYKGCVGCSCSPSALLAMLEDEIGRTRSAPPSMEVAADQLRDLVREVTEPAGRKDPV